MKTMNVPSRTEAQQRADDIRIFQQELQRLEQEGVLVLSAAQRDSVGDYHRTLVAQLARQFDIDRDLQSRQLSLGMRIASFLGALALAASAFFLFHQFWGLLGELAQVAILSGAALASFLVAMWIRSRDASGYFTKLAAMVAFACFVLNISMLGRIFNITPSDMALLPWAALAFLLAYTCNLRLLLAAGILCMLAFVEARIGTWGGMYWVYYEERPENFFLPGAVLFAIPQIIRHDRFPGFAATYRVSGLLTLFLPVLVLANWGQLSYLDIDHEKLQAAYQMLGFIGSGAAVWLGTRRQWPEVVNTGVTLFTIFLYTKFFDWWWNSMPKYLFFMILGLSAILLLLVFRRLRIANAGQPEGAHS